MTSLIPLDPVAAAAVGSMNMDVAGDDDPNS